MSNDPRNTTVPRSALWLFIGFLVCAGTIVRPLAASADPCDYLIVTVDALADAFAPLAAHREAGGYVVEVVTMETILAETAPEEDDPATLRAYLAARHAESGVAYVLLGGGAEHVPVRLRRMSYGPPYGERFYPTDLYYACHDGTWNADGDSLYGEAFDDGYFDVEPEVLLGRIPVRDATDVAVVVDKILTYENSQADYKQRALVLGPVILPHPWQQGDSVIIDGAEYCEIVVPFLEDLPQPISVTRMYADYTAYTWSVPLTGDAATDSLATGNFGLVDFFGRAAPTQIDCSDRYVTADEFSQLTDSPNAFVMTSLNYDVAAFDIADNLMSEALWNPDGGICAGIGFSTLTYLSTAANFHEFFYRALGSSICYEIGPIWQTCLIEAEAANPSSTTYLHLTSLTILGDPAMPLWPPHPTDTPEQPASASVVAVESCYPNPFNPSTIINYTLSRASQATVAIFDARGMLVRELVTGAMQQPGRHTLKWNGRDDRGTAVASGSYYFRIQAGA